VEPAAGGQLVGLEGELDLPEGARLVGGEMNTDVGQLKGRVDKRSTTSWADDESTSDLAKVEWVIEAPSGTEIGIEARHPARRHAQASSHAGVARPRNRQAASHVEGMPGRSAEGAVSTGRVLFHRGELTEAVGQVHDCRGRSCL
jgi:hypothetical protein